jgi:hypothetical protein
MIRSRDLIRSISSPTTPQVEGTINLIDEKGGPICGRVVGQKLNWRVLGMKN